MTILYLEKCQTTTVSITFAIEYLHMSYLGWWRHQSRDYYQISLFVAAIRFHYRVNEHERKSRKEDLHLSFVESFFNRTVVYRNKCSTFVNKGKLKKSQNDLFCGLISLFFLGWKVRNSRSSKIAHTFLKKFCMDQAWKSTMICFCKLQV